MPPTSHSFLHKFPSIQLLSICTLCAILAAIFLSNYFNDETSRSTTGLKPENNISQTSVQEPKTALENFECTARKYTTHVVSVDPLLIYIDGFLGEEEADLLVELGSPSLAPSEIYLNAQKAPSRTRTSRSAGLPPSSPLVSCILDRALLFIGPSLPQSNPSSSQPSNLDLNLSPNPNTNPLSLFGTPQIVQYGPGEHFATHHDWYDTPQLLRDRDLKIGQGQGQGKWMFNRWASFFVYLDEGAVGGETWFPYIDISASLPDSSGKGATKWRSHRGGDGEGNQGVDFLPKKGNALFWVNLHANGTGDGRVVHAGLRVKEGTKTAMNIWPRVFYKDKRGGR
ncbi:hypothetical protein VTL71DRAFT_13564 [Oculimacula yallundae]|uniref:Prolyl 4-hydroxylase alpha subunit domain-containing protein n=1 Tax=Oculimacula yallundae TaxID=86028 RepID=A0ABR4CMQ5_9HELO